MKILITDDEPHVIETIRMLIPWEEYGIDQVLQASGGKEAIHMIMNEKPQIVFTDIKMPGMSGIELLQWIHQHAVQTKVIVVSGYDDYQFMRSALQYGGFDYILKPIDPDELIQIFGNAVSSWNQEESQRSETKEIHKKANQLKPVLADKLLSQLIVDPEEYTSAIRMLETEYQLGSDLKECRVAVISWDIIDMRLRDKFINAMELLRFAVTNICNEFVQKEQMGIAFQNWHHHHDTVLLFFNRLDEVPEVVHQIQKGLYTALRGHFYMGIGGIHSFPQDMSQAYEEAQEALKLRNLLQREPYIHVLQEHLNTPYSHPLSNYEDELFLAMQKESPSSIREILMNWLSKVDSLGELNMNQLEMWWQEFVNMQSKWLKQTGISKGMPKLSKPNDLSFEMPLNEWEEVKIIRWIPRMESILMDTGQLVNSGKPNNLMDEIEQYIRINYCNEIKLHLLAEMFHLSPSHLSRSFKQQFSENITDYITRLRIGKAKLLLTNPALKISAIASQVGYQDEKYFSKAFKQAEGMSPKDFRSNYKK